MVISRAQLQDLADVRFSEVIEQLQAATPDMNDIERAGVISAMLLANGIQLAFEYGAPREVVEDALLAKVAEVYGDSDGDEDEDGDKS